MLAALSVWCGVAVGGRERGGGCLTTRSNACGSEYRVLYAPPGVLSIVCVFGRVVCSLHLATRHAKISHHARSDSVFEINVNPEESGETNNWVLGYFVY